MTPDSSQPPPGSSTPPGTPSGLAPTPPTETQRTIVDVHAHLWDCLDQLGPEAATRIRRQFAGQPWDQPDTSAQAFDQAMEPVDHVIVLGIECGHVGASIPATQVARYVARQPDKIIGFAGIDPMESGCLAAVGAAVDLGLAGVTVSPAAAGFHPSDSRAMRLYERCEEIGLPMVVHPGTHLGGLAKLEYGQPYLYDEVARAFPDLRLILGGVGLPWAEQALILVGKHAHCYADLSDLTSRPWQLYNVLLLAHQQGVMNGLLFGSDFPFVTPQTAIHNIYSVNTVAHGTHLPVVPREQLRCVVERDALACLGLKRPAPVALPGPSGPGDGQDVAAGAVSNSGATNVAKSSVG